MCAGAVDPESATTITTRATIIIIGTTKAAAYVVCSAIRFRYRFAYLETVIVYRRNIVITHI